MAIWYNRDRCNRIARGVCQGIGDLKYLAQKTRMDECPNGVETKSNCPDETWGAGHTRCRLPEGVFPSGTGVMRQMAAPGFFSHPDFTSPSDV
ncbi:MAG: hypothetical protein KAR25_00025 [Methanosarcinales archaeon]|nr:hypothetical protein [Methanosarcinales archaeon]